MIFVLLRKKGGGCVSIKSNQATIKDVPSSLLEIVNSPASINYITRDLKTSLPGYSEWISGVILVLVLGGQGRALALEFIISPFWGMRFRDGSNNSLVEGRFFLLVSCFLLGDSGEMMER